MGRQILEEVRHGVESPGSCGNSGVGKAIRENRHLPRRRGLGSFRGRVEGRVAEWLKAPDSKLFLPLWTALLTLGQKWRFRPISLGFYNFHLDTEGRRKTRFSTGSIQVEYTSGSIQVSPCHPQDTSDFR
jgi:hypothetical protein